MQAIMQAISLIFMQIICPWSQEFAKLALNGQFESFYFPFMMTISI